MMNISAESPVRLIPKQNQISKEICAYLHTYIHISGHIMKLVHSARLPTNQYVTQIKHKQAFTEYILDL